MNIHQKFRGTLSVIDPALTQEDLRNTLLQTEEQFNKSMLIRMHLEPIPTCICPPDSTDEACQVCIPYEDPRNSVLPEAHMRYTTTPPVHQWIASEAFKLAALEPQAREEMAQHIGNVLYGTGHEDTEALAGDIVIPFYGPMPFLSHYWNPDDPEKRFLPGIESTPSRAIRRWMMAMAYYARGDKANAYDQLGHVIHLISDMSVPAHVHWDLHAYYDTYEMGYLIEFNDELKGSYNYKQWTAEGLVPATISNYASLPMLLRDTADISKQFDSTDCKGTSPQHTLGHSATWEHQPKSSLFTLYYDVSYADAKVHANTCMPAAISHAAAAYTLFWQEVKLLGV